MSFPFRQGQVLCQWPLTTVAIVLCHSEWHVDCLSFSDSIIFFYTSLYIWALHQLEWLSHLKYSPVPLHFLLPIVVIATGAMPSHWAFHFQGSGLPLSASGSWSESMCMAYIVLQELEVVVVMLHRMAFWLSHKLVILHLDNCTAKAYLCNQGGTVSPFLSRLACQILNQTEKYSISLIPANIPTHLNFEANYLSWDRLLPQMVSSFKLHLNFGV